jgi:hypothetical protein
MPPVAQLALLRTGKTVMQYSLKNENSCSLTSAVATSWSFRYAGQCNGHPVVLMNNEITTNSVNSLIIFNKENPRRTFGEFLTIVQLFL